MSSRKLGKLMALLADLVLVEANVRTMNPSQPVAEAVAIKKGRIIKVGTNSEVSPFLGKRTRVVNLKGKTVVPGFIDAHVHFVDFAKFLRWLDLSGVKSIVEMQSCLREQVKRTSVGQWIVGRGWNQRCFREKRFPSVLDLDTSSPENPVILYHESDMIAAVNSMALRLAGITAGSSAPAGGVIERDTETCKPTGILLDTATDLVWNAVPEPSEDEILKAITLAFEKIAEVGVTSIHWLFSSANEISVLRKIRTIENLPIRIYVVVPVDLLDQLDTVKSAGNATVRIGGAMISTDGYLASKTAALFKPYENNPNKKGSLLCSQDEIDALTSKIIAAGLQPVIHAVGDKAVDATLTTIENTEKDSSNSVRYRIEHAAVLNQNLIERISKRRAVLSMQPSVMASEFSVWSAIDSLGEERAKWLYPLKTLLSKGIRVIGGSDCPMEPLNPLIGIQEAVNRACFSKERISIEEALRMYTVDAAYSSNEEDIKGSIEAGKLADLTVLSHDLATTDPKHISNIKVELTIIDGKIVFPQNYKGKVRN